ncbi:ABC transporter permease [Streptomyces litchfieldiae]|uniref:ABC transporter permease n=1 Tax=Streptomyces litchfieldiae TaxID=3075543 RepID=A0ABU2MW91_9ACTN|nr:ABC transporter permease [Streptomyces sp. DSM 44938]MDT0345911.1 ABC transporter permease [Streptomyces sp. DSM 44938]
MSVLGRVVRSGVGRRRVPTVVIGLATLMAVAASVLGGSLLVASSAPFDKAFARQQGAHLSLQFDAGETGADQLSAAADAPQVTATAGPFRTASVTPEPERGIPGEPMTVVGRADPGGPVDNVALTEGRWATGPGEIVLSADSGLFVPPGMRLAFPELPGEPTLTVVGLARSVSRTADAWVVPSEMDSLTAPGTVGGYQMLYRFTEADTAAQVTAGREAVTAGVPAEAAAGAQSWLAVKKRAERDTALFVPFLIAFGVLGLVMSALIVGNVVAGTVGAGLRRIGILKAIGFTPGQVVRAHMGQALIPAAVGAALGAVVGHLLAVPVLSQAETAYRSTGLSVDPRVDAVVLGGVLGVVAVTAWASAWRAGRLRTVDAIAVGRARLPGRGRWAARVAARLPLPRPVGLGLTRPFARPARALATGTAVVFGTIAVTFTFGLSASLSEVLTAREHNAADVTIGDPEAGPRPNGPGAGPAEAADPAAVTAAIDAQPGTRAYYGAATTQATVSGTSGSLTVFGFTGDASWGGYRMVSGRWFDGPGEAVVPTPFLTATGTRVGDTVTLNGRGGEVRVRIVGEVFDTRNDGMDVFTDAATLTPTEPDLAPTSHHIAVTPGTDVADYIDALNAELSPLGVVARTGGDGGESDVVVTLNALATMLTLLLVAVAALGVLNGVVLDTRERVRELGVHKALGMTPRQVIAMVVTSVVVTGLAGGALGVPIGVALHGWVMPAMGDGAGLTLPDSVIAVYDAAEVVPLALGGLLIAVLGALLPAGWAARTRTATALRTE